MARESAGCECSAQHFGVACCHQRRERLKGGDGGVGVVQNVVDRNQLVRIGALIAVGADGRGDGPDGDGSVAIVAAGDVAQAVGGGVGCCSIALIGYIQRGRVGEPDSEGIGGVGILSQRGGQSGQDRNGRGGGGSERRKAAGIAYLADRVDAAAAASLVT